MKVFPHKSDIAKFSVTTLDELMGSELVRRFADNINYLQMSMIPRDGEHRDLLIMEYADSWKVVAYLDGHTDDIKLPVFNMEAHKLAIAEHNRALDKRRHI